MTWIRRSTEADQCRSGSFGNWASIIYDRISFHSMKYTLSILCMAVSNELGPLLLVVNASAYTCLKTYIYILDNAFMTILQWQRGYGDVIDDKGNGKETVAKATTGAKSAKEAKVATAAKAAMEAMAAKVS